MCWNALSSPEALAFSVLITSVWDMLRNAVYQRLPRLVSSTWNLCVWTNTNEVSLCETCIFCKVPWVLYSPSCCLSICHDSCVYALMLLFPIICLRFPPSSPSLCFQPQLSTSDWSLLLKQGPVGEGRTLIFPLGLALFAHVVLPSFTIFVSSSLCAVSPPNSSVYSRHRAMPVALFWGRLCWLIGPVQVRPGPFFLPVELFMDLDSFGVSCLILEISAVEISAFFLI